MRTSLLLTCRAAVSKRASSQGDPRVAQFYEKELADKSLWPLGEDLRTRYEKTKSLLLKVQNHDGLLGTPDSRLLAQKLALRAPYVTPLNVLQVCACRPPAAAGEVNCLESLPPSLCG